MANELQGNINKKLLRSFTKNFMADVVVSKSVERQLVVNDFDPSTGTRQAPQTRILLFLLFASLIL